MEEENNNNIIMIDRISELPEFIVHHTLSFLDSPADLVRSSMLSKKWFDLTASFPILDFNIRKFSRVIKSSKIPFDTDEDKEGYERDSFFKYVAYTTSRFCEENIVSVHTFKLYTSLENPTEVDIVDRCLDFILQRGVQELQVDIFNWKYVQPPLPMYRLPNILLYASSLICLALRKCELPSSLMTDVVKFKSLSRLHLNRVPLSEEMIKYLTTNCPLLEEFIVERCCGFKNFCVYGHQNLQKVRIYFDGEVERIDIEAPNMCDLTLFHFGGRKDPYMNLVSCKKLTSLYDFFPSSIGLARLSSNFPFLENLILDLPYKYSNLKLSSHSLRTFVLLTEYDLDTVDLNTPNLLLFEYKGYPRVPSLPSKARMECYPDGNAGTLWFQNLRCFLGKNNGFKELKLCFCVDDLMDVEELKASHWQPFELEHVDLEPDFVQDLSGYLGVVDAVLWCCRPRSLTLESYFRDIDFEEWCLVVKFAYEKLLKQEDQGQTSIQFVLSSYSKTELHFSDLNLLLKALPRDRKQHRITFVKEQVVEEAG